MCSCERAKYSIVHEVYVLAFIIDGFRIHIGYGHGTSCIQIRALHKVKAAVATMLHSSWPNAHRVESQKFVENLILILIRSDGLLNECSVHGLHIA